MKSVAGSCFGVALVIVTSLAAQGSIRVADDFESASLGIWRIEGDTRLVFVPRTDHDQDGVNSAVTWFFGKISNVLQREVVIEIEGLDYTVYNGKRGDILPFERNTRPVFSYDRQVWHRFTDCSFDKGARTFRMRQVFAHDTVWVAYIPPYTLSRLEALLAQLRTHPGVAVETYGRSAEGRPLYLVTLTGPGSEASVARVPVVWITARQHSFEAGGSWSLDGLLRFLTSEDAEAAAIREKVIFKLCPMANPDGVVEGGTRFNARGVDLNRHWHEDDPLSHDRTRAPEIVLLKQAIGNWSALNGLDLFINIHNNDMVWNDEGDYIRFAPSEQGDRARRLEAFLREGTIYTGPFLESIDEQATEAVVAKETGAVSLLMEMKTGYLESLDRWAGIDTFREHGRGLARAVLRFLTEDDR